MRRVVGLFLAVICLLLVPTLAPAADLFGLGTLWGSSWGQALAGSGGCCGPGACYGAWGKCCPAFYVGYDIRMGRDRKPFNLSTNLAGVPDGSTGFNTDYSDPGGLWLGVSNYCQLSDSVGIMASGWYLFPSTWDAQETYYNPFTAATGDRIWQQTRSWGWIDGALVLGSPCGLNLIGGFRWDSYSVNLKNPDLVSVGNPPRGTTSDEANVLLNSYIPFLGTQCCYGGPCCGLLVRVIGFPWCPGRITFGETGFVGPGTRLQFDTNYTSGRFLEVFSEYSYNCPGGGCIGIFARFNYLGVKGLTNPQIVGLPIPVTTTDVDDADGPRRTSWTIGGRMAINFDLPSF